MQEVMYTAAMLGTKPGVDVEHIEIDCPTGIHAEKFSIALAQWVGLFETLRTGFHAGGIVQLSSRPSIIPLKVIDLSTMSAEEAPKAIETYRHEASAVRMDLASPPLMRAALFQLAAGKARVLLTVHHLIYDGRCAAELLAALFHLYDEPEESCESAFAALSQVKRPTFAEFAAHVRSIEPAASRRFFESLFAGFEGAADLKLESPKASREKDGAISAPSSVGYVIRDIDTTLMRDLNRAAERLGATVNTLFQVAWGILLARYSGTTDVSWGTTRVCRQGTIPDANRVIGMCINTVPCRLNLAADRPLAQAVQALRQQHLDVRPHEHTSPALVQEWCGHGNQSRLFNTLAVYERFVAEHEVARQISSAAARSVRIYSRSGFDLTVMLSGGDSPRVELVYERAAVRDEITDRVVTHLLTLLDAIASATPHARLSDLAHLSEPRRAMLARQAHGNSQAFPADVLLHRLFERMVDAHPQAICLRDETRALTYSEVDAWANRLADVLLSGGIEPGQPVPILVGRSIEYVVAVLAILKAGGAYAPLELSMPGARIARVWETLLPTIAICTSTTASRLPRSDARSIVMDQLDLSRRGDGRPAAASGALANVIFTSGSTGDPKGVMIPHRAIVRLVYNSFLPFEPTDVYLLLSSVAFDASTLEIWAPLLTGATLSVYPDGNLDFERLRKWIRSHGITRLWLTSALFNAVIDVNPGILKGVKTVLAGGEALSPSHVARAQAALPDTTLMNGYGPTENTTFTCVYQIPAIEPEQDSIPVGPPIDHTIAMPLDVHGQPVDTGFTGELFIGGDGLAMGYLRDEQLTDERFVTRAGLGFSERFYRSGDLMRLLPGGSLDFLERLDGQIKLRGKRIDPGEIESAILRHTAVKNAALIARGTGAARQLIAYVVCDGPDIEPEALRQHLRQWLPEYMIPRSIVMLEQLPITINGKLDRAALERRAPVDASTPAIESQPVNETERRIQRLIAEVLEMPQPALDQGIIELGINSLSLIDLSLRLKREFGPRFLDQWLAANPSARDLAGAINGEIPSAVRSALLTAVGASGRFPPMFMVPGIRGNPVELAHLSKEMGRDRRVYIFRLPGSVPGEMPAMSIPDVAGELVKSLEAMYPAGPIHLVGYSLGAMIAYEMAHQLRARGRFVPFLGLIDSATRRYIKSTGWQFGRMMYRPVKRASRAASDFVRRMTATPTTDDSLDALDAFAKLPTRSELSAEARDLQLDVLARCRRIAGAAGVRAVHELMRDMSLPLAGENEMHPLRWCGLLAFSQYVPPAFCGDEPLHLFVSLRTVILRDHCMGWRRITKGKLIHRLFRGDHFRMINPRGSAALARVLREITEDLQEKTPP